MRMVRERQKKLAIFTSNFVWFSFSSFFMENISPDEGESSFQPSSSNVMLHHTKLRRLLRAPTSDSELQWAFDLLLAKSSDKKVEQYALDWAHSGRAHVSCHCSPEYVDNKPRMRDRHGGRGGGDEEDFLHFDKWDIQHRHDTGCYKTHTMAFTLLEMLSNLIELPVETTCISSSSGVWSSETAETPCQSFLWSIWAYNALEIKLSLSQISPFKMRMRQRRGGRWGKSKNFPDTILNSVLEYWTISHGCMQGGLDLYSKGRGVRRGRLGNSWRFFFSEMENDLWAISIDCLDHLSNLLGALRWEEEKIGC